MPDAAAALRETVTSARLVLGRPDLRRLNLAALGSGIGDGVYATAIGVYAFLWGGAPAVGGYVAVRCALSALVVPVLAPLVDRLPRRRFLVLDDLARVVLTLLVAGLIWLEGPALLVLALAIVIGIGGSLFRPTALALTPSLAGSPHELTAANAMGSTVESLTYFVGPALGGVLLVVGDPGLGAAVDALTFAWSAALLARIGRGTPAGAGPDDRAPDAGDRVGPVVADEPEDAGGAPDAEPAAGFLTEVLAGFRVVGADRAVRLVVLLLAVQTLVAGAALVFTVVVAVDLVGLGQPGVGYLTAAMGAGSVLGGLVALGRARLGRTGTDFAVGVLLWSAPLLLVTLLPTPVPAVVAFLLLGAANPLVDVNMLTLLQRLVPDALLGRVFVALESVAIGTAALGGLLMPVLVRSFGVRGGLAVLAVPVALAAVLALPALHRLQQRLQPSPQLGLVQALALFQPLSVPVQEDLAGRLERIELAAGTTVVAQGEPGDRFYLVESGRLDAVRGGTRLTTMGPGDCFGEIALLRDVPRTATVITQTPAVVHALDRADFLGALAGDPESASRADTLVTTRILR